MESHRDIHSGKVPCRSVELPAMERDNFEKSLRAFQRRRPFQTFTVELTSGDRLQIDRPEAMVLRSGVAVYISSQGVPSILDHEDVSQIIGEAKQTA
jgi:hypothetical protein